MRSFESGVQTTPRRGLRSRVADSREFKFQLVAPASALAMWVCLWLNLNTGFWNIQTPENLDGFQLMIRAVLPFVVLPMSFFFLVIRKKVHVDWNGPSRLLMAYGAIAGIATFFSPEPMWSAYWSVTFLATILTAWNFLDRTDPLGSTRQMLNLTWLAAFVVAAIIGYQAQNSIFGHASTAYGVVESDLQGLSRSSGVARWAAVPGLVCLIRAFHSRRILYFPIYLGIAVTAFYIVYRMQSRGAVFGSVAALLFCLLIGSRLRKYALPFGVIATIFIMIIDTPAAMSDQMSQYVMRGQTKEQFRSMTGRTRAYENGMAAFEETPLLGRGQWTDRLVIKEHVHNSYLQALLNAGIVGGIPYLASWGAGWILFFKLQKRRARMSHRDRLHLLEAGTVMMFFTVRAIPETTTASFAVDLLVMVAVYVYFEALMIATKRKSRALSAQMSAPNGTELRTLQMLKAG